MWSDRCVACWKMKERCKQHISRILTEDELSDLRQQDRWYEVGKLLRLMHFDEANRQFVLTDKALANAGFSVQQVKKLLR